MDILSANVQSRWPDSFAGSEQVKLTLRANGEEETQIIDAIGQLWPAGFDAPTAAPTAAASATAGSYTAGQYVAYRYVYASSKYPFVENAVTGGGEVWPRSAPSAATGAIAATAGKGFDVTVTGTTRLDVDWIWIYRTDAKTASADAVADAAAGLMFYCGRIANPQLAVTTVFTDTGATFITTEQLELDNFPAPVFWKTVFDGTYWWGFGNPSFDAEVELDGASGVTLTDATLTKWFSGRSGQSVKFDGITSGGYDGRGTFYFGAYDNTTGTLYLDAALTTPLTTGYTGATKIHIQGPSSTLYRSKPRNPFAWGYTQTNIDQSTGDTTLTPLEWALNVGGGNGTAIAFLPDDNRIKLDLEQPTRTLTFELNQAADDPDTFATLKRTLSTRYSVGSHHAQFAADLEEGRPALLGLDAKNWSILACDGELQQPISTKVFATLRAILDDSGEERFFHGVYDPRTELACWWVKTVDLSASGTVNKCDTLIWFHAPTGAWGVTPDQDISASALVYDPETDENLVLTGSEKGHVARAFAPDTFDNYRSGLGSWTLHYAVNAVFSSVVELKIPVGPVGSIAGPADVAVWDGTVAGIPHGLQTGDYVAVFSGSSADTTFARVLSVTDPYIFSYDQAVTDGGNPGTAYLYVPVRVGDWVYLFDPNGAGAIWGRIGGVNLDGTDGSNLLVGLFCDVVFNEGDAQGYAAFDTGHTPAEGWIACLGVIPCRARTYFDLKNPSKAKRSYELWSTMENVDPDTNAQSVRFYREFAATLASASDSFALTQNTQGNGSDSVTWLTSTRVPSWLAWQFGIEFVERGYLNWTLYDATLKVNVAS